jgi:ribulose-5-phosphate 4-epimerase/fuculose-1-phosphate aldolase
LVSRGNNKPSSELGMHLAVLNKRKGMRAVLHFQAPYATVLSSSESNYANLDYLNTIPEVPYYIGKVGWVPYHLPGSKELVEAVSEKIMEHDAIFLQNHGQLVVGKDLEDLIQKALFLEQASMIMVNVKGIKILSEKQCEELRDYKVKRSLGS